MSLKTFFIMLATLALALPFGFAQEPPEPPAPPPPSAEGQEGMEEEPEMDEGLELEAEDELPGLELPEGAGLTVVRGTAWAPGERRSYTIFFDGVPIGQQSYAFRGAGTMREWGKRRVFVYELAHALDMRFFGTAGRCVMEGRLVTDEGGRPLYYRLEESFNPVVRYDVNKGLMDFSRYQKTQVWFHEDYMEYARADRRRGEGPRQRLPLEAAPGLVFDQPLWGHLFFQFQYVNLKRKSGELALWTPFERPRMDYFVPQDEFGAWKPSARTLAWTSRRERGGDVYAVNIPGLGARLRVDRRGRVHELATDKGLTLRLAEE